MTAQEFAQCTHQSPSCDHGGCMPIVGCGCGIPGCLLPILATIVLSVFAVWRRR